MVDGLSAACGIRILTAGLPTPLSSRAPATFLAFSRPPSGPIDSVADTKAGTSDTGEPKAPALFEEDPIG